MAHLAFLVLAVTSPTWGSTAAVPPIPQFERWEANMVSYGLKYAAELAAHRDDADVTPLIETAVYYDAARTYHQIGTYTGDPQWRQPMLDAIHVYRDRFVIPNGYDVAGHVLFSDGMLLHLIATGDAISRETVLQMAAKDRWTRPDSPIPLDGAGGTRETAYALKALINARAIDGIQRPRIAVAVDGIIQHIDQWFVSKTAELRPFFIGLALEALIAADEAEPDPRILPAVRFACDGLWDRMWVAEAGAFRYTDNEKAGTDPTADLNLLIAPAYAWVYRRTGDARYLERGDLAFAGGVRAAYLDGVKQFHQNYRWSFAYVAWRSQPPLTVRSARRASAEKKAPVAVRPAAPVVDTAPWRDGIAAALREHGRWPVVIELPLLGDLAEVSVVAVTSSGVDAEHRGNVLPVRWHEITDADLARLGQLALPDEAPALDLAWRLAGAAKDKRTRDAIGYRLLKVDEQRFRALSAPSAAP
ncbi:MAG: hypothetical protein H0X45_06205 [Planctomycetes bacterium]|nr:hypothetical protein [Planctomycetota bacterium]